MKPIDILSILGSLAGIISMFLVESTVIKVIFGIAIFCIIAYYFYMYIFRNLNDMKQYGISRVFVKFDSINPSIRDYIKDSSEIKICNISGINFLKIFSDDIENKIIKDKLEVKILLSNPQSSFIKDMEQLSNKSNNSLSSEINLSIDSIEELKKNIIQGSNSSIIKASTINDLVKLKIYNTEFRNSFILFKTEKDLKGLLTIAFPPKTSTTGSISFELKEGILLNEMNDHFDSIWDKYPDYNELKNIDDLNTDPSDLVAATS